MIADLTPATDTNTHLRLGCVSVVCLKNCITFFFTTLSTLAFSLPYCLRPKVVHLRPKSSRTLNDQLCHLALSAVLCPWSHDAWLWGVVTPY